MKRYEDRFNDFSKALKKLKEAFMEEPTEIIIDGTLQRYEFTFELSWKLMKDYLEYSGIVEDIASPREIIKSAFQANLISNGDIWIQMMLDRNLLSHLYDEDKSREIYNNIKNKYLTEFSKLEKIIGSKI
jgi:nucleotidyltransferase substrate binding protein (TIGR01987 family)